jgi:hypothetical protein
MITFLIVCIKNYWEGQGVLEENVYLNIIFIHTIIIHKVLYNEITKMYYRDVFRAMY